MYELFDLENQFLSKLLIDNFDEVFEKCKNPLIEYIVFDLGGVYFDGDYYEDFLDPVCKKLGVTIKKDRKDKLLLDERLNTGEINIAEYIQSKIDRELTKDEVDFILYKWRNAQKPNKEMQEIVGKLNNNRYIVTAASNLDKDNGQMYIERGDFEKFTFPLFLSYELKKTKPSKTFFNTMLKTLNAKPYEILIIDDHEKNIHEARKLGMHTIRYSNKSKEIDLKEKFKELGIIID